MVGKASVARRFVALACALLAVTAAMAANPARARAALSAGYTQAYLELPGAWLKTANSVVSLGATGGSNVIFQIGGGIGTFGFLGPGGGLVPGTYVLGTDGFLTVGGCSSPEGTLTIDDAVFDGGGSVTNFSARFQLSNCATANGPMVGQVSYHSTADFRRRSVSAGTLAFGAVLPGTTAATQSFTITNSGPSDLHVASVTTSGANANQFTVGDDCPGALVSSRHCTVTVGFSPTTVGLKSAHLTIVDDVSDSRTVVLSGTGGTPPHLVVDRSAIGFHSQRVGTYGNGETVTLRNTGDLRLHLRYLRMSGNSLLDFFGETTCDEYVLGHGACTVTLYSSPSRRGARRAVLEIGSDTTNGTVEKVTLTGSGTLGYYLLRARGQTAAFGDAAPMGDIPGFVPGAIVAASTTPNGEGLWAAGSDGSVYYGGNAVYKGSLRGIHLTQPIVGMASTPAGKGYWLVARDGGIFAFGDAKFRGSTGALRLHQPIVGMASTVSGKGYWLVAADGGIFAFGDAKFYGSTGAMRLNQPIVGMAATPSGRGYWLVASDGGIFAFGDAHFYGSTGAMRLTSPIVGIEPAPDGRGYWFVALDGGLFSYGPGVAYYGSLGGRGLYDVTVMAGTAPPLTWLFGSAAGAKTMVASDRRGRIVPHGAVGTWPPAFSTGTGTRYRSG